MLALAGLPEDGSRMKLRNDCYRQAALTRSDDVQFVPNIRR